MCGEKDGEEGHDQPHERLQVHLGFGRIVASEKEAPILLANMV
jgi:hypothetical protein